MKYVGMSKYSEELTYSADVPENMNDASLEDGVVEPLPRRVEEIFREFKMNLSQGAVRRKLVLLFQITSFTVPDHFFFALIDSFVKDSLLITQVFSESILLSCQLGCSSLLFRLYMTPMLVFLQLPWRT